MKKKVLIYEYIKHKTRFTRFMFNIKSLLEPSDVFITTSGKVDLVLVDLEVLKTKSTRARDIWDELQESRGGGKRYILIDDGRFAGTEYDPTEWYGTPIIGIGLHYAFNPGPNGYNPDIMPSMDERMSFPTGFTPFVYDYRMSEIVDGTKLVDVSVTSDVEGIDEIDLVAPQVIDELTENVSDRALLALKNTSILICAKFDLDLIYQAIRFKTRVVIVGDVPKITNPEIRPDLDFKVVKNVSEIPGIIKDWPSLDREGVWFKETAKSKFINKWIKFLKQV